MFLHISFLLLFLSQKQICRLIRTIDFCNIDTSRNFLSEGGGKQSLVPLEHRVTIATATGRERGVGFEGLDPAELLRRDSLRWQWPVREKEFFEREFDRLVDFSCAFR